MISLLAPLLGLACRDREGVDHHAAASQTEISVSQQEGDANIEAPSLPLADERLASPATEPPDSPSVSGPEAPPSDHAPLEDLIRLPESVSRSHEDLVGPRSALGMET